MHPLLLILQVLLMNWYITKIVFNVSDEPKSAGSVFDEQLRLVAADSTEEAFLKARTLGLHEEDIHYNDEMKTEKWEFVNVSEVLPLENLKDGIALYSHIHQTKEASAYVNVIHQKAIAIRMDSFAAQH